MKVIRLIFEGLFPAIISVGVAIGFQWAWGMWLLLYYSITLMLLGMVTIAMGLIGKDTQNILIFGIALLLAGIALIFGKLAEKANQEIKTYLVRKSKREMDRG